MSFVRVARSFWLMLAVLAAAGSGYILIAPSSLLPSRLGLDAIAIAIFWVAPSIFGIIAVTKGARWPWLFVIVLHFVVYWTLAGSWPGGSDQRGNLELVQNMHAGLGYMAHYGAIPTFAYLPPGYPSLLTAWTWVFGLTQYSAVALNFTLDFGAAATIFAVVRRRAPAAALACAFAYLVWPDKIISSLLPSKEGLALLLFCQFLMWLDQPQGRIRAVAIGISAAGLGLTQPAWALLAVLAATLSMRLRIRDLPIIAMAGCAVMAPWWLHCYRAFGTFVLFTASGPLSMEVVATGNNFNFVSERLAQGEIAGGRAAFHHAMSVISADVLHFLQVRVVEAIRTLAFDLEAISLTNNSASKLAVACQIFYVAVLALASRCQNRFFAKVTIIAIVAMIIMAVPFEFAPRHKEFLIPLAIIAAGLCRFDPKHLFAARPLVPPPVQQQ